MTFENVRECVVFDSFSLVYRNYRLYDINFNAFALKPCKLSLFPAKMALNESAHTLQR